MLVDEIDPRDNLGLYLKTAREKLSISLEQISKDTKIQLNYLMYLEENIYDKMPERIYVLGYLRSYVNYLNLSNVNELIAILDNSYDFVVPRYSAVLTPLDEKQVFTNSPSIIEGLSIVEPSILKQTNNLKDSKEIHFVEKPRKPKNTALVNPYKSNIIAIVFSVIFILLVLFVVYGLIYSKNKKSNQLSANQNGLEALLNDTTAANLIDSNSVAVYSENMAKTTTNLNNMADFNETLEGSRKDQFNIVPFPEAQEESFIRLVFADRVWVQIYNELDVKRVYLDRIFEAGDRYNIPAVDGLAITIGNSKGVSVYVNSDQLNLNQNSQSVVVRGLKLDKESLLKEFTLN